MTIKQAADVLNVPVEYLLRLLVDGTIPCHIEARDVLVYKKQRDEDREKALQKLVELTEEYGGYNDPKVDPFEPPK